jgi:taurine dioxygenase
MSSLAIQRLAGALGAEICGVDLSRNLTESLAAAIRQALLDHQVIFFRDQDLNSDQFLRFAQAMGQPIEYPFVKGIDGYPVIIPVTKLEHERSNFGGIWHSDTTYLQQPPMGSMLLAREVPPYGGDTLFASQYLAYETLSEGMRKVLDGLVAVNSSAKADVSKTREDRIASDGRAEAKKDYVAEHPAVRTHPETGRKALYVNVAHTSHFKGMTPEESAPLLQYLFQHQVRPEFTCRFAWRPGSLAFWDNRCAQHNPVNDYHGFRRVMHRITLAGDTPR